MNKEKTCQGKNSDSAKKFVRTPFIAIRGGPVLYTPKNALPRRPAALRRRFLRRAHRTEGASPPVAATGCAASEGDSAHGSPRDGPARCAATSVHIARGHSPRRACRFDSVRRIGENRSLRGGGVAQLGEHHVRNVGVEGSNPFSSTIFRSFVTFREKWHLAAGFEPASGADRSERKRATLRSP